MCSLGAEIIKQLALAVEDLHDAPQRINHVEIAFRVDTDRFGPEHGARAVADLANRVLELSGAVEYLDAEIHRIDNHEVGAVEPQFGGEIELAFRTPLFADGLDHLALHVEHEDLVAKRVG